MSILHQLKKIDLFSQSFTFYIGKSSKKKKTCFGGILSLLIILTSTSYISFLFYLYFGNKLLPKITKVSQLDSNFLTLPFEESLLIFQLQLKGRALQDIERETGKKYINIHLNYAIYNNDDWQSIPIPLVNCGKDTKFDGYSCMDFNQVKGFMKELTQSGSDLISSNYEMQITSCKNDPNCATQDEIDDLLFQVNTNLFINIVTQQFNSTQKEYEKSIVLEYFQFDNQLTLYSVFSLFRTQTEVQQGLILQTTEKKVHLADYKRLDRYFSQDKLAQKIGFDGYALIVFQLDQTVNKVSIQYPVITEILSQFMSVFNVLIIVGIFASIFSESTLVEDVNDIFLKEYYKETAIDLLKNSKKKLPKTIRNEQDKIEEITFLQNQIKDANFLDNQKETFKISMPQRQFLLTLFNYHMLCRLFGFVKRNKNRDESTIYQRMIEHTVEKIDIFEVYRELIKLRMAIKVILSKEQYAALKFCGCSFEPLQDSKIQNKQKQNDKQETLSKINGVKQFALAPKESSKNEVQELQKSCDTISSPNKQNLLSQRIQESEEKLNDIIRAKTQSVHYLEHQRQQENKNFNKSPFASLSHKINFLDSQQFSKIIKAGGDEEIQLDSKEINNEDQQDEYLQEQIKKINHLEEIDALDTDQDLLQKSFSNFMVNFKENNNLSQIDINIYNSLIGRNMLN